MPVILDSSAILAMIFKEAGGELVSRMAAGSLISAVNLSEVASKLLDAGFTDEEMNKSLEDFSAEIVSFDRDEAIAAGHLRASTRQKGLSLGDRACLALALQEKATVLTADKAWTELDLGIEIKVIR